MKEYKKLYRGFDPECEKWDRRLLFEVTGIRIDDLEFRESDTSDDERGIVDAIQSSFHSGSRSSAVNNDRI